MTTELKITRREALATAGSALACGPALRALAADKRRLFKIGACDWSIGQRQKVAALEVARQIGLDGVQVSFGQPGAAFDLRDPAVRKQYAEGCKKHGVEVSSLAMGILNRRPYASDPDTEQWVADSVETAPKVGVRIVLLAFFGKGDLKNKPDAQKEVVRRLKRVAPAAEKAGAILGIESTLNADEHLAILDLLRVPRGLVAITKRDLVDEDLLRLKRYYEDAGYYRVIVRQGESELVKGGKGVVVHFTIVEGPPYDFGEVRLTGNRIFSDAELQALRYCRPDAPFSRSELEKDALAIGDRYRDQGYLYTRTEPRLAPRDDPETDEHKVDLTWEIRESQRYRLREVRPQGVVELEDGTVEEVPLKTKDFVILREMQLESGDVLDWSKVRASDRKLLNLGYFKRERDVYPARLKFGFQPEVVEEEDLLDLALRLEEEPTGLVTFGAGFSTAFGPSVFGSVQERNLFGRGWRGSLSGSFGTRRQSVDVNFTEPHLFNSDYSLGIDFYRLFREAFGGREFDETRTGGSLRLGREIAEDLRATVRYKFEQIEIEDIDVSGLQDTIRPDPYVEGTSTTSSFELSLVHDTRDYILFPSQGHRYAASVELAGMGGDNEFWKVLGNASWYHPVAGKLVLAYDLETGMAQGYGGTDILPLHERFFNGGANSVRGFEEGGLGPRGIYAVTRRMSDGQVYSDVDDVAIGGELELVGRTELRYPFTDQLQGVVFFDSGAAWGELEDLDLSELRLSTGIGVLVNLPIGAAVRLDLAVPLKKESGDDTQYFHFGFNQSF